MVKCWFKNAPMKKSSKASITNFLNPEAYINDFHPYLIVFLIKENLFILNYLIKGTWCLKIIFKNPYSSREHQKNPYSIRKCD